MSKKVSIVIPALNEAEAIQSVLQAIPMGRLEGMGFQVQVIVVDNGSTDGTGELASRAGATVLLERRRGYGRAYRTAFREAQGDIIATVDGDLSYPVEEIPDLVALLEKENIDFLTTNRFAAIEPGAMSPTNRIGNGILNLTVRFLFGVKLRDSQSGMWVFRKSVLNGLKLRSNYMSFSEELKMEVCFFGRRPWQEVGIPYRQRVGPVKLRSWRDGILNWLFLFKKRVFR